MNWNQTNVSTVDTYINKSVYFGASGSEGIDLRQEMNWILYGKTTFPTRVPKGHWVVYRRYDRTQKSIYYSERTKEGVGGPPHIFTDALLRTRKVPINALGLVPSQIGMQTFDKFTYYFEYTVNPKPGDNIFELDWSNHALTPNISTVTFTDRYIIKGTSDFRLENGNIQYWSVSVDYDEVAY
jgi:hypothetical protein